MGASIECLAVNHCRDSQSTSRNFCRSLTALLLCVFLLGTITQVLLVIFDFIY